MQPHRRRSPNADRNHSPRMRLAARLYASGAAKSKGEAADIAGVSRASFYVMSSPGNGSDQIRRIVDETTQLVNDETVDMSIVLRKLGRQAVGKLHELMTQSPKEDIQLRAAIDLADRGPETMKVQKHVVDSFSISGEDAKELARIMIESAQSDKQFEKVATEGLVEVVIEERHGG